MQKPVRETHSHSSWPRLNRPCVFPPRIRNIVGGPGEGRAGGVRHFFVSFADPANHILPSVVPADVCLAVNDDPGSMSGSQRFFSGAIPFQVDGEVTIHSAAFAHRPFAKKAVYSRFGGSRRSWRTKFNAGDVCHGNGLLMTVLKNNHERIVCRTGGIRLGNSDSRKSEYPEKANDSNQLGHESS